MPLDHATLPPCLKELTVDELLNRIERLIEDWHSPTLSPMGLCRLLDLSVVQIRALITLPLFAAILDDIRFIQNARREWINTRAADHAFDRLVYITHQSPTSAAACKEIRLAAKAILEITGPPLEPTCSRPSEEERAPSVSEGGGGVFDEPEASAPGLPNQPRLARSGSTTANDPETSDNLQDATTPPSPAHLRTPNDAPIVQSHQPQAFDHRTCSNTPEAPPCAHSSS